MLNFKNRMVEKTTTTHILQILDRPIFHTVSKNIFLWDPPTVTLHNSVQSIVPSSGDCVSCNSHSYSQFCCSKKYRTIQFPDTSNSLLSVLTISARFLSLTQLLCSFISLLLEANGALWQWFYTALRHRSKISFNIATLPTSAFLCKLTLDIPAGIVVYNSCFRA